MAMKKISFVITSAILLSSCAGSRPAPYENYGTKYYGKNNRYNEDSYANNSYMPPKSSSSLQDYNSKIDQQNASRSLTRPVGSTRSSYNANANTNSNGEVYSHQLSQTPAGSNGISSRPLAPLAIDGGEQVVKLGSNHTTIHSGGSVDNTVTRSQLTKTEEETVPPVEHKEGFINPSQVNQERKSEDRLGNIKPMPKPEYTAAADEGKEVVIPAVATTAAAKPKIVSKVQKVETSSGTVVRKTTTTVAAKPAPEEEEVPDNTGTAQADEGIHMPPEKSEMVAKTTTVETKTVKPAAEEQEDVVKPAPAAPAPKVVTKTVTEEKQVASAEPAAVPPASASPAKKSASNAQFIKPVDGVIVSEFGSDKAGGGFNDGVSIQAPEGTPVKAAGGGTVVYSGNQLAGYGNLIIIRHNNGFLTAYSHLKELELKKGATVGQGDVIGHVGKTGNVDTPQLHFGIRKGREPVDPKDYI